MAAVSNVNALIVTPAVSIGGSANAVSITGSFANRLVVVAAVIKTFTELITPAIFSHLITRPGASCGAEESAFSFDKFSAAANSSSSNIGFKISLDLVRSCCGGRRHKEEGEDGGELHSFDC